MTKRFRLALLVAAAMGISSSLWAQNEKPPLELSSPDNQLVDQEPFHRVYLDEYNDFAVLDIERPEKDPPKPIPTSGILVFEWLEDDEFTLEVPWSRVIEYKTFNDMLLEEADLLLSERNYSRAFRNLLYVYDNGGRSNRELESKLRKVLLLDANQNFQSQNYGLALSIFEDVYQRNPSQQIGNVKAINQIMKCYGLMLQSRFDDGNYDGVRFVMDSVSRRYGDDVDELIAEWDQKLISQNRAFLDQARQAMDSGNADAAHKAARKAIFARPGDLASLKMLNEVIEKYPLVYVGVSQTSLNGGTPNRIEHWAASRMGRLTQRSIVEFAGLTDEGGDYQFLNGTLKRVDEDGLRYQFEIDQSDLRFGVPRVTAYQVAQQLLNRADEREPSYYEPWAKIVETISIDGPTTVTINLRIPFVRPEAVLQMPYVADQNGVPVQNGPYVVASQSADGTTFRKNSDYEIKVDSQYPELVELNYDNPSDAVDALLKGDIDIVDRIPIQDLRTLSRNSQIQLQKYLVPTIHMLVPNIPDADVWRAETEFEVGDIVRMPKNKISLRCVEAGTSGETEPSRAGLDGSVMWVASSRSFLANLNFRSGLMHGIDRTLLVNEVIAGGREVSGCEVIDAPFPIGTEDNDQIGYAYNPRVRGISYERGLGIVFAELVRKQMVDAMITNAVGDAKLDMPEIILAHPKGELPRSVCQSIQLMWGDLRLKVKLRELPAGQIVPEDDNYDFLYVELSMKEPLTDVEVLFGNKGIVKSMSPSVQQLVRDLSYSTSWQVAGRKLRRLHRQVRNDLSVMPLFQVQEYFAYRKNVNNIGRSLVNLYENIDQWEVVPWEIEEEEE